MPAILSALCSAIFAYFATKEAYGDSLYTIFPGMKNSTMLEDEHEMIIGVSKDIWLEQQNHFARSLAHPTEPIFQWKIIF